MRVVLIGATGLIGSKLTRLLVEDGSVELHTVVRRASGCGSNEHVAPPADWPEVVQGIGADAAVSALGTTMRAAGSEAAFQAVDFDMVSAFARAARAAGARQMVTVSSVGADVGSRNFYLRLKGELEGALAEMGFDRVDIFRPGLLRGKRGGERRIGERIGIAISPVANLFLQGPLERFAAIDAELVAAAVAASLRESAPGVHIHENRAIRRLACR